MKLTLNLASRPYVNRSLLYATYGGLLVVLLLLALLNLYNYLRGRQEEARLQERIAELQRGSAPASTGEPYSAQEHEGLRRRILLANAILERDSARPSALFERLERQLVDGVRLATVQPDGKGRSVRLGGNAADVATLRRFLDRLVATQGDARVYILQQSQRKGADGPEGIDFAIEVHEGGEP